MKRILRRVKMDFSKQIGKVLLKCVVFIILFSILFTSLYIKKVSNNLENNIIKKFDIYIEIDPNIYYKKVTQEQQKEQTLKYVEIIEDIANHTNISYYDFNVIEHFRSPIQSVKIIEDNYEFYARPHSRTHDSINYSINDYNQDVEELLNGTLILSMDAKSARNVTPKDFQLGNAVLEDGRMFTLDEINHGENVCLVNEQMAILNKNGGRYVEIGDTISISEVLLDDNNNIIYNKSHDFTVIGTYKKGEGRNIVSNGINTGESPIFIPEKQFQSIYENISEVAINYKANYFEKLISRYELSNAIFKVDTIQDYRDFLNYLDEYTEEFNSGYKFVSTMDDIYPAISSVLAVSNTINYISVICLVVCIVITFILILFEIDGVRKDIGILLSMGESIKAIVGQYLIEMLLISLLATSISFVFTQKIGVNVISSLIQQNASEEIVIDNPLDISIEKDEYKEILMPLTIVDSIQSTILYVIVITGFESIIIYYLINKIDPKELMKDE